MWGYDPYRTPSVVWVDYEKEADGKPPTKRKTREEAAASGGGRAGCSMSAREHKTA